MRRSFLGRAVGRDLEGVGWLTCTPAQFLALRQDQIRRLEAAREHDRAAIAASERALAAGVTPRPV